MQGLPDNSEALRKSALKQAIKFQEVKRKSMRVEGYPPSVEEILATAREFEGYLLNG